MYNLLSGAGMTLTSTSRRAVLRAVAAGNGRVISDCHPSEKDSKNRTQIPIIHRFYFFSALPSLG
jgi:hypothetical protein